MRVIPREVIEIGKRKMIPQKTAVLMLERSAVTAEGVCSLHTIRADYIYSHNTK